MKKPKFNIVKFSLITTLLLVLISWIYIFTSEGANLQDYFSEKNIGHTKKFLSNMVGLNDQEPAFLSAESWRNALGLTYETLAMSIMAIGFTGIGMLLTVTLAARTTADGSLTLSQSWLRWIVFGFVRFTYIFSRAVPELIWAMFIIFIFKPGILPGAIALALHNFGILGKLCAEVIEDLELRPIRALRSSGANMFEVLLYGVFPTVTPKFITFLLYRWEVIIRTTVVVGFVGAGGLGQHFKLSMSWFNYTEITLVLICYLLLVLLADAVSGVLRKIAQ